MDHSNHTTIYYIKHIYMYLYTGIYIPVYIYNPSISRDRIRTSSYSSSSILFLIRKNLYSASLLSGSKFQKNKTKSIKKKPLNFRGTSIPIHEPVEDTARPQSKDRIVLELEQGGGENGTPKKSRSFLFFSFVLEERKKIKRWFSLLSVCIQRKKLSVDSFFFVEKTIPVRGTKNCFTLTEVKKEGKNIGVVMRFWCVVVVLSLSLSIFLSLFYH